MDPVGFAKALQQGHGALSVRERAVALLWFLTLADEHAEVSATAIAAALQRGGWGAQNSVRTADALGTARDRVTRRGNLFRLKPTARPTLEQEYGTLTKNRPLPESHTLLDHAVVLPLKREYVTRVVNQLNVAYDEGRYDCAAMMMRRLIETLIIELYERQGRLAYLQGSAPHPPMLDRLIDLMTADPQVHLGRETGNFLKALKKAGDLSSHDRRYFANQDSVKDLKVGLGVATQNLVALWKTADTPARASAPKRSS